VSGSRFGFWVAILALLPAPASFAESPYFAWGYNSYGVPGLLDMPQAMSRPDAELDTQAFHFKGQTRVSSTFQVTPRLSGTFRYAFVRDIRRPGTTVVQHRLYDRSFSVHYRFFDERRMFPALAVGLNDIVGTGVYAGEYVVASKTLSPQLRATAGIGWGRLGSFGGFTNPLGVFSSSFKTRPGVGSSFGGTFHPDTWFRGPAALFGGVEWQASDRLRLIAEYSSDDYTREDGVAFDRRSPLNFGLAYRLSPSATLTASYLYGSAVGLQLNYTLNPRFPAYGSGRDPAPPAIVPRAQGGGAIWPEDAVEDTRLGPVLSAALAEQGLALDGLEQRGGRLRIAIRNEGYSTSAQALGRAARVLSRIAPAAIDTFAITLTTEGVPVTTATLSRDDLENLAFHPVAPDLLRAVTRVEDERSLPPALPGRYPVASWGLGPYLTPSLFDPDNPVRADAGVALRGRVAPLPGLVFEGVLHQKVIGNLDKSATASTSTLPHVRSDSALYFQADGITVPQLTAAWYFRPGRDLFGRVTAGYLETMYGGVSTELLWKPQNSPLALGVELNRVRQRDYNQLFDFRSYEVTTGHVAAYYAFSGGIHAKLSAGRYLAGDNGATLEINREFDNGWRVGVFATKTNVSAADFGEGSFDKGIRLTIPLDWVIGRPNRTRLDAVIRPITRDGGARLEVPGRLYERVRNRQASTIDASWGRFWK